MALDLNAAGMRVLFAQTRWGVTLLSQDLQSVSR